MKLRIVGVVVGFWLLALSMAAQTFGSGSTSSQVPPLIQFSNVATDEGGNTLSGVIGLTFSLYAGQQGGAPLWTETQNNVQLDPTGHYSVELGITKPNGVPTTLFTTGAARWLGVQVAEQPEQPRVLLLSVPYALKAGDAATIGGLPPSAFVLAAPPNGTAPEAQAATADSVTVQSVSRPTSTDVTTSGGIVNFVPLWDSTSDIISSVISQQSTGSDTVVEIGPGPSLATTKVEIEASQMSVAGTVVAKELQLSPVPRSARPRARLVSQYRVCMKRYLAADRGWMVGQPSLTGLRHGCPSTGRNRRRVPTLLEVQQPAARVTLFGWLPFSPSWPTPKPQFLWIITHEIHT